jgi:CheY-like chemotaxis protein
MLDRQRIRRMAKGRERILVIGRSIPLMEGVADLLQVVGYPVQLSPSWDEAECRGNGHGPPDLVIVDLSGAATDGHSLARQLRDKPHWSGVPILFISFTGDDSVRELQRSSRKNGEKRLYFYAHTLLGADHLLAQVRTCLA